MNNANSDSEQTPRAESGCPGPVQLGRLLDEALSPDDEAALSAHLQRCPKCQQMIESLAADGSMWAEAGDLLAAVPSTPPPEPALVKAVARLEGRSDEPRERDDAADLSFLAPARRPGDLGALDHYDILSVVGRGGMGIVLKAHDALLERVVAVKIMAPSLTATAEARKRFIREAQAAAAVAHDHVVTIHAVEPKNIPYLVMQFVAGTSLEDKIRSSGPLEVKEILRIGLQTAAGLAAAHAQGLVHRDVKPANILLENGIQRVRITDFGLARLVDDAGLTQSGVIAGTPQYMSPEQVRDEHVDCRADLFSLGSVLYAMCTGQAPFRAGTSISVLRKISDEVPLAISELNAAIPTELVAIVEKLHCKNREDRFQSAAEVSQLLAEQLARLQSHGDGAALAKSPVDTATGAFDLLSANLARPLPRRRWPIWAALAAAGVALAAGIYSFGPHPRNQATLSEVAQPPGATLPPAERPARPFDAPVVCLGHTAAVNEVIFSPDETTAISAGEDKTICLWNSETGELRAKLTGHEATIHALAISPDGQTLASASDDGVVRLWDAAAGRSIKTIPGHQGRAYALAFSPDGRTLASAGDDCVIRLWPWNSGSERALTEDRQTGFIRRLAFSPDGNTLVSAGQRITFWDMQHDKPLHSVSYANTSALRWDDEGRFVAAASWRVGLVTLFDPADGRQIAAWQTHDSAIEGIALWPEQDLLFSVGENNMVRAWNPLTQQLTAEWTAHAGRMNAVAIAPRRGLLATGGAADGLVKIWNLSQLSSAAPVSPPSPRPLAPVALRHTLSGHTGGVFSLSFSPAGDTLASAGRDTTVRLWKTRSGEAQQILRGHARPVQAVAFSPDGLNLASAGGDSQHGDILLWDITAATPTASLSGYTQSVYDVAFSPDSQMLASSGFDQQLRLYDVGNREEIAAFENKQPLLARRVCFADDGRILLTCGDLLSVYDVVDRTHQRDVPHAKTSDMKLSPRGDVLAAAAWKDGAITLYRFPSLERLATWRAHRADLEALAFSPDGRYLASASSEGTAKIWQVADQRLRAVLLSPRGNFYAVAYAPDGQTLATSNGDDPFNIYLWDVSALGK